MPVHREVTRMKKTYNEPELLFITLDNTDVLTASGDNDAPFISIGGGSGLGDKGWSNYY